MSFLNNLINTIRGLRKWSIMFILIVVSIVFRMNGLLTGLEFVALLKTSVVAFFASNSIEHVRSIFFKKDED